MQLNMRERVVLLNILPQEEDITTIKIVHKLRMELAPSEKELKDYKILQEEGRITWDDAIDKKRGPKEVKIGPKASVMIEKQFKKLSDEKKFTEGHLEVYMKFCEDEKEEEEK